MELERESHATHQAYHTKNVERERERAHTITSLHSKSPCVSLSRRQFIFWGFSPLGSDTFYVLLGMSGWIGSACIQTHFTFLDLD